MESASPRKSLPQSWSGMLSDLVHQKTKRSVWKLFWKLDSLAVLNRSWTACKTWVTNGLPWMKSVSPRKCLPHSWSGMLSDLVHQKTKRSVWKLFWKLDCLALPNGSGTVYKRRVTNSWPRMELASPRKSLPQSWSGMLPDLVHQKTRRRVWKLFRKRDCLAVLNRSWTVCKRWVTNSGPRMDSASPRKSLPHSWPAMLRLGPPKKKRSVWKLFWKLDCLALPNGSGTVYKRRVTNSWPRMELASPRKSLPQSWSGMLPDLVHQKTKRKDILFSLSLFLQPIFKL